MKITYISSLLVALLGYHLQSLFSLPSNSDIIYKQFSHSSKTASTMLYDDMTDIESSSSVSTSMHFYDEVTSTMDTVST